MSGYVDLYDLKRAQAETGLTPEAKETMIIVLFDGEKRSDDNITLKRWMAKHGFRAEEINLIMAHCDDKVIQADLVERVKSTCLPKEEALRNMLNSSNAVAASARRRVATALLLGSEETPEESEETPEEADKKAGKKALGKKNQEAKAAKKQARREKRQGKKKPKSNKKRDNKGKKKN